MNRKKLFLAGGITLSLLTMTSCSILEPAVQEGSRRLTVMEDIMRENRRRLKEFAWSLLPWDFDSSESDLPNSRNRQKLESPEEAPSFVAASDLFLYLLESDFFIGQQGELSFTVLYGSEITGPITITDETGALLCTLENDGSGMVLGTCPIFGENPRSGALTASSGAWESDAAHFYVQPEITDEMMDRLFQVGEDVSSAIETAGYEDPYSEAAFAFVQDTLEEHPDVAFVGTNNDVLLFETTDHLAGCYGLSADYENQLTFGGFSDINSAFEEWINGDFVSDQVISSGAPSTNSRYLFTSTFTGDRLIDVAAPMYSEMMENLAEHVDGTCQSVMGNGAYSLLRSGAFTDAGFWMHCTHGKPMLRSDGTNMLFSALFDATVDEVSDILGTDRQMFYHSRHTLWDEAVTEDNGDGRTRFVGADTYRMVYEVISDDTDRIWTSTRFLEDCLGDQIFDNTIIYFCVCYAYSDPVLQNLLISHGASAFMGCEKPLDAGLATSFWNQLSTFLGTRDENEEYYALLQALNSMTYSKNDACVQELYQSLYRGKNMTAEEHEESMTENLDDYIDAAVHAPISCVMRGEGGSRVLAGSSVLSGSVLTEQDSDNEEAAVGVEDATVTLYRWLDHDFHKQGEQQTDQNGIYQLDHLDYGMYIAHAEKDGLESYRSIVVSKSGIQAEPIYLGILISGEVLDEDTELPLSDAEVALVSALGFKGETAADPDGCWEMLIPAASCEASFSCSGYQDKGMMISKSDLDGGTRHFQIYLKKEINYYKFIRDELLPDMGYANLAAASRTVTPNQSWSSALGWDIRKGLLGADIADLDKDGTDDLLVYFFDASAVSDVYSAIYASLYTISEDNEIILVNTILMDDFLSATSYDTIQAGLMEVGGNTYLYTETNSNAYFANGSELMYCWYCYDGSMLRPCWKAGKTDGGSTDIAYSLLTYSDDQNCTKQVLWADGLFRSSNPNAVPLTDGEIGLALEAGFSLIGLPAPSRILCENSGYSVYSQKEVFPSYWNADILKPSVQYLCSGSGTYSARNMQVSAADFTDLQRHIEELED